MLPNCQLSACIKCVLTNKNLIKVLDGKTLPKEIGFEDDGSVTTDLPLTLPKLIKVTYITLTDITDRSKKKIHDVWRWLNLKKIVLIRMFILLIDPNVHYKSNFMWYVIIFCVVL